MLAGFERNSYEGVIYKSFEDEVGFCSLKVSTKYIGPENQYYNHEKCIRKINI